MSRLLARITLVLLICLCFISANSQTIDAISGAVRGPKSITGVAGVKVLVNDTIRATTDSTGFYRITMAVTESVTLKYQKSGYETAIHQISPSVIFTKIQELIRQGLPRTELSDINIELKYQTKSGYSIRRVTLTDSLTSKPLAGVAIATTSNTRKYVSGFNGVAFVNEYEQDYGLTFSKGGYKTLQVTSSQLLEMDFQVVLTPHSFGTTTISSLSRREESWLPSTTSVELLTDDQLKSSPYLNAYSSLAQLRGVEMVHSGIGAQSANTMGLAAAGNSRMLFLTDGIDNQLPDHNYSIGNLTGISELDIERIEVIPMTSSAIYGPNAMNGVINVTSKSPFDFPGVSASAKAGINNIRTVDGDLAEPLFEFNLRYAHKFNEKFALKVGYSYLETTDWQPSLQSNNRPLSDGEGLSTTDPGYDGSNSFGDEFMTLFPLGANGSDVNVTRTGYDEIHLFDYGFNSRKLNFAFHFKPFPFLEAILQFDNNLSSSIFTGINRVNLPDLKQDKLRLELRGHNFHARYANNNNQVGLSYDAQVLGRNLVLLSKINTFWFLDFGAAFGGALVNQGVPANDVDAARIFADGPGINNLGSRLSPTNPTFESVKDQMITGQIQQFQNLPTVSEFEGTRSLEQAELFYDFEHLLKVVGLQLGYASKTFELNNGSIYFQSTNDFEYSQSSVFGQISKTFFDRLKIQGNFRIDENDFFSSGSSLRGALSFEIADGHFIRGSYNEGFRFPSFYEMFGSRDMGRSITGGTSFLRGGNTNTDFIFFNQVGQGFVSIVGSSLFLKEVNEFDEALRRDMTAGVNKTDAVNSHIATLSNAIVAAGDLTRLRPEKRNAIEIGYRAKINKLIADFSGFYSETDGLIAPVGVVRPFSVQPPAADINAVVDLARDDRTRQIFYFYQNAQQTFESYGVRLGLSYDLSKGYSVKFNGAWNDHEEIQGDIIEHALNAPPYMANFLLANENVWRNLGFTVSVHWQDSFTWRSNFVDGTVGSFTSVNAQATYSISHLGAVIRVGAQNLLGQKYVDNFGGPTIGSVFYFSVVLDDIFQF